MSARTHANERGCEDAANVPVIVLRSHPPLPAFCTPYPLPPASADMSTLRLSVLRILSGQSRVPSAQTLTHSEQLKQLTIQGWRLKMLELIQVQGGAPESDDQVALGLLLTDDFKCSVLEHGDEVVIRLRDGHTVQELALPSLGASHSYAVTWDRQSDVYRDPEYTLARPTEPSSHSSSVQAHPNANFHAFQYPDYSHGYRVVVANDVLHGTQRHAKVTPLGPPVPATDVARAREAQQQHKLAALMSMARANSAAGAEARAKLKGMNVPMGVIRPPRPLPDPAPGPAPRGRHAARRTDASAARPKGNALLPHSALVIGPGVQGTVRERATHTAPRAAPAPVKTSSVLPKQQPGGKKSRVRLAGVGRGAPAEAAVHAPPGDALPIVSIPVPTAPPRVTSSTRRSRDRDGKALGVVAAAPVDAAAVAAPTDVAATAPVDADAVAAPTDVVATSPADAAAVAAVPAPADMAPAAGAVHAAVPMAPPRITTSTTAEGPPSATETASAHGSARTTSRPSQSGGTFSAAARQSRDRRRGGRRGLYSGTWNTLVATARGGPDAASSPLFAPMYSVARSSAASQPAQQLVSHRAAWLSHEGVADKKSARNVTEPAPGKQSAVKMLFSRPLASAMDGGGAEDNAVVSHRRLSQRHSAPREGDIAASRGRNITAPLSPGEHDADGATTRSVASVTWPAEHGSAAERVAADARRASVDETVTQSTEARTWGPDVSAHRGEATARPAMNEHAAVTGPPARAASADVAQRAAVGAAAPQIPAVHHRPLAAPAQVRTPSIAPAPPFLATPPKPPVMPQPPAVARVAQLPADRVAGGIDTLPAAPLAAHAGTRVNNGGVAEHGGGRGRESMVMDAGRGASSSVHIDAAGADAAQRYHVTGSVDGVAVGALPYLGTALRSDSPRAHTAQPRILSASVRQGHAPPSTTVTTAPESSSHATVYEKHQRPGFPPTAVRYPSPTPGPQVPAKEWTPTKAGAARANGSAGIPIEAPAMDAPAQTPAAEAAGRAADQVHAKTVPDTADAETSVLPTTMSYDTLQGDFVDALESQGVAADTADVATDPSLGVIPTRAPTHHASKADLRYLEVQRELAAERARQDRAGRQRAERQKAAGSAVGARGAGEGMRENVVAAGLAKHARRYDAADAPMRTASKGAADAPAETAPAGASPARTVPVAAPAPPTAARPVADPICVTPPTSASPPRLPHANAAIPAASAVPGSPQRSQLDSTDLARRWALHDLKRQRERAAGLPPPELS
ncbi:hypothetical protein MSPP1_002824 [Malassezia sp. CBS 17886]|nr:hypothetical protein MSPP1_002824 [Malassezia sp. CBS 17886]